MRSAAFARNPDLGYFGITFDLCISIPVIYALVVVRGGHARPFSIVPVFIACMLVARFVVPTPHRGFLHQLGLLQAPLEFVVLIAIALRLRAATGSFAEEEDLVERIELICRPFFGDTRINRIVAGEMAALYLGLFGWRLDAPKQRGLASTTFHSRIGWGSIVACILLLIAAEGVGVHLLLQRWNPYVAWIVTALDLWGAL